MSWGALCTLLCFAIPVKSVKNVSEMRYSIVYNVKPGIIKHHTELIDNKTIPQRHSDVGGHSVAFRVEIVADLHRVTRLLLVVILVHR